jgi:predicted HNH restriction endonuclease
MPTFLDCLDDSEALIAGLATLDLTPKQNADLELLYARPKGLPVTRDSGSRVRGETVHTSSRIGKFLTSYFKGVRPTDLMMWVGHIERTRGGSELWILREQMRAAIGRLRWFDSVNSPSPLLITVPETLLDVQILDAGVLASSQGGRNARLKRLREAPAQPERVTVFANVFIRNPDVVSEVLFRAKGMCEGCRSPAPFNRSSDGSPYLEVHHRVHLSQGGSDTVENALALCPNCHRQRHFA